MTYSEDLYDQFTKDDIESLLARAKEGMLEGTEVVSVNTSATATTLSVSFSIKDALEFCSGWYQRFDAVTGLRKRAGSKYAIVSP